MTTAADRVEDLIKIPLINKAFTYASAAHAAIDHRRKYSGAPYIVHPVEVAAITSTAEDVTNEMIAAALLHDVVEDTKVTIEAIHAMFGGIVALHVNGLTDISKPSDGNRAHRKMIDREHTWSQAKQTQTIKVADLIANARDIIDHDQNFAKVYIAEKRLLLEGMNADEKLMKHAWEIVNNFDSNQKL